MRLLHTSDWHVGKMIKNRSRMEEFAAALDEVVRIAVAERVDAVLIAGDLFDHKNPGPDPEKLVYETLLRLHFEKIPVVAIAGNHDSAGRLNAVRELLGVLDVSVICQPNPDSVAEFVDVPSRSGDEYARVAGLPFLETRFFTRAADLLDNVGKQYSNYSHGMAHLFGDMEKHYRQDALNILCGHFMVSGARIGGAEQELTIGMAYAVEPGSLPGAPVQYLALGHVHRPQSLPGSLTPGAYSGSLLQLDFSEAEQRKEVVIVEGRAGSLVKTSSVSLSAGRSLRDVEGTLEELRARAGDFPGDYLRVRVRLEQAEPGLQELIREFLPNAIHVIADYPRDEVERPAEMAELTAHQQFELYYQSLSRQPSEAVLGAFDEIHAAALVGDEVEAT